MIPYGNIDLGQDRLRQWLVAWWHQAIARTNVDSSSVTSSEIRLRAISQEIHQPFATKISLKFFFYLSKISFKSSRGQQVKDRAPADDYQCPIFKWVPETWQNDRAPEE